MSIVTIQEAQARLSQLIHGLNPGDEVLITENNQPVAKLARTQLSKQWPCKAGSAKGKLVILQEDDEHLKDFEEYMR